MKKLDFTISALGKPTLQLSTISKRKDVWRTSYVSDDQYILYDIAVTKGTSIRSSAQNNLIERAGPREKIYFDPAKVHAGVVTCGGLCPGLNDVIRAIVMTLCYRYDVKQISGFRYGYRGFLSRFKLPVMELTPDVVTKIHRLGGTILGASRGSGDCVEEIVDTLERMNINMLFTIGGDGTQKGALDISEEAKKRSLKIAVVGIPKTIDNDLSFVQKSFGFQTAVSRAVEAVDCAHVEAHDGVNGIGIVKVMGRESGFIAAHTAMAINDVNYVLIPEVPFDLEGENGLLTNLERRLKKRNHAVILVAEGAGQEHMDDSGINDASGNKKLGDIGIYLKERINEYFERKRMEINLKYIDPSYMIRSAPANPNDSTYCARLGAYAVHAAMAGKTGLIISLIHSHFVHVPIHMAVSSRKCINPHQELWRDVTEATGQPLLLQERRKKPRKNNKSTSALGKPTIRK
ncbi:MAG: 6-phosphofructokinase [Candidatus Scalindua rubra]|uniref:ATP-dependent 6-phosphofructokinase n=1 Tax=Candidatus Scalindua rubra TaxID=1872076 RepID=A0A1E3X794_9BACT|nr:MAG: 6-phosphofructokinase [Candidatus Scalindua rubra]